MAALCDCSTARLSDFSSCHSSSACLYTCQYSRWFTPQGALT